MRQELKDHLEIITSPLEDVPEISGALQFAEKDPLGVGLIYVKYLKLAKKLAHLTEDEKEGIRHIHERLDAAKVNPSHINAATFLDSLSDDQIKDLGTMFAHLTYSDPYNPLTKVYWRAVAQLTAMMRGGHELKQQGQTPNDDSEQFKRVIWGHTQISQEYGAEPFVHFTICHLMERYISQKYRDHDMLHHKDTFLTALTDVILLEEVRKPGSTKVMSIWQTPKSEGGLGWINQATLQEFQAEFGQH